jgi:hypothetical protein
MPTSFDLSGLAKLLASKGVNSSHYSLGTHRDERTCLVPVGSGWEIYYAERGKCEDFRVFASLEEAGEHLVQVLCPGLK